MVAVFAHSTDEQVNYRGELIPGTELDIFAFGHVGQDSDGWYGYFDFMTGCECPPEHPTEHTPIPSPTKIHTMSPSSRHAKSPKYQT
jgi:hypothetical protein